MSGSAGDGVRGVACTIGVCVEVCVEVFVSIYFKYFKRGRMKKG